MAFPAYGDAVPVDGEIIFVDGRPAAFTIEVDERSDAAGAAVLVISHGVMGGIEQELFHISFRQELFHGEPVVKEAERIVPGRRTEEWEEGQVVFRVRGCEHVEVIAEVETSPVGIPADVTVGLAVGTGAFTVPDSLFKAAAGSLFPFLRSGINRGAVAGDGKMQEVDEAVAVGFEEEKLLEYLEKPQAGLHILGRILRELIKEVLNRNLFDRRSLLSLYLWLARFFLRWTDFGREVVIIGKPEAGHEIIKRTGARGIADGKAGEDGMEKVFLEVGGPPGIRSDLELHGKEDGAEHVGREPGSGSEIGITVAHDGINLREVKCPELLDDFPGGGGKGGSGIRIIFTELNQDTILVGGMAANVNRFQKRNTPNQKSVPAGPGRYAF